MSVVIVDYGSGNLRSAARAFERAVAEAELPDKVMVTGDPYAVRLADRVVLPGVGAFADCRNGLWAVDGMPEALREHVIDKGNPFFGICVGVFISAFFVFSPLFISAKQIIAFFITLFLFKKLSIPVKDSS